MTTQDIVGHAGLALFEYFAHAADRSESRFQRGFQPQVHRVVGLAEVLPPLRVSDDDMIHSPRQQLANRYFTRKGAFFLPMHVLRADRHVRPFRRVQSCGNIQERRADDDLVARVSGHERKEVAEEVARLVRSLVHLPVGSHYFFSHEFAFSIWNEFVFSSFFAACSNVRRSSESKRIKRHSLTDFADCNASIAAEIAMRAASLTGYPNAPVEIAGKEREVSPCSSARRIDSR